MVLDLDTVTQNIEQWIVNFVEVPHPALGGWPPCPYARAARLKKSYQVRLGTDPLYDLKQISAQGLEGREVIILAYDPALWPAVLFSSRIHTANQHVLLAKDLIALEDHPKDPEIVNGVSMNQGTYALALVQSLSDLNTKARAIGQRGFYHSWPKSYLDRLFEHRENPRS